MCLKQFYLLLPHSNIIVYIDGLLVYNSDHEQHKQSLVLLFKKLLD
jgi:hypothetical protein